MQRSRFVTHKDLRDHHEQNVKPSLSKIDDLHRALMGGVGSDGAYTEGALGRLNGVESAQKTATKGLWVAITAGAAVLAKSFWDALRGPNHQ